MNIFFFVPCLLSRKRTRKKERKKEREREREREREGEGFGAAHHLLAYTLEAQFPKRLSTFSFHGSE
jgi:hypothetical protein